MELKQGSWDNLEGSVLIYAELAGDSLITPPPPLDDEWIGCGCTLLKHLLPKRSSSSNQ